MRRACLTTLALLVALARTVNSEMIVYDFTGQPGNEASVSPTAQVPNVTASPLTRSATLTPDPENGVDSINSRNWGAGLTADFYQFSVTPSAGMPLSLTSLDYTDRRSATGPTNFQVSFAIGGATTSTPISSYTLNDRRPEDGNLPQSELSCPPEDSLFSVGHRLDLGRGLHHGPLRRTL